MTTSYFVHMIDDDPVLVYGPYALRAAKDFARIGAQYGAGRRAVFDGPTFDSRLIRVYDAGNRIWPTTKTQLADLAASERPRVLAPKQRKPRANPGSAAPGMFRSWATRVGRELEGALPTMRMWATTPDEVGVVLDCMNALKALKPFMDPEE